MDARFNSEGLVGPFFRTAQNTYDQAGPDPVGYFHFRALNDKGISYLLDETTQAYLQNHFTQAIGKLNAGETLENVMSELEQHVEGGLPQLKDTIKKIQGGILFDFEFIDLEISQDVKPAAPITEHFQYQGWHSHQAGMGPDARPHSHDTFVNFEFIDNNGQLVDISVDEELIDFIDTKLKAFFDKKYLNTSGEEIVQKLFELGEALPSMKGAPETLKGIQLAAAEMTLQYKGDMDHPHIPMLFRVTLKENVPDPLTA